MKKLLLSSLIVLGCIGFAAAQERLTQPAKHPKKSYAKVTRNAKNEKQIAAKKAAANRPKSVMMEKATLSPAAKTN